MAMAAALNAIDTLLVRVISTEMSAFSISFFRSAFGLLFVLPWIHRRRAQIFKTNYVWLHVMRAALKVVAISAFFYAIARANLAQVTAIAFTTPIFVIIGAVIILHEKLGITRQLAELMGFGGVLLIVRPIAANLIPISCLTGGSAGHSCYSTGAESHVGQGLTDTLVAWIHSDGAVGTAARLVFWTTPIR
jgi:drug/metabolite transporter (DMT)-like permease